jgi:hypothetical protein
MCKYPHNWKEFGCTQSVEQMNNEMWRHQYPTSKLFRFLLLVGLFLLLVGLLLLGSLCRLCSLVSLP